jgi:hypothetical protein
MSPGLVALAVREPHRRQIPAAYRGDRRLPSMRRPAFAHFAAPPEAHPPAARPGVAADTAKAETREPPRGTSVPAKAPGYLSGDRGLTAHSPPRIIKEETAGRFPAFRDRNGTQA